jgi:hypothetical protein
MGVAPTNALELWTVYDSPTDLAGRFVARKWLNDTQSVHRALSQRAST